MEKFDSFDAVLEFAIEREIEANQFYLDMAKRINDPAMKKTFENFAKEELGHKEKLELELMKRGTLVPQVQTDDEARALEDFEVAGHLADDGAPLDMDYEDLLIFAIKKEDRSIQLYNDLAKIVKDEDSRQILLFLVKEETDHKQRFETQYKNLQT